jgi:hypothetical protein
MSLIEFQDYPSTETPLNAENLNYNFNELAKNGTKYGYTLTRKTDEINSGAWLPLADDLETDVIPAGKYLMLYTATVTGKSNELGISTFNPFLGENRTSTSTRQTIPVIAGYSTTGQCVFQTEFTEDAKHIINLYQYANQKVTVTSVSVFFYRIG